MRFSFVIVIIAALGLGTFAPGVEATNSRDGGICIVADPYQTEGMAKQLAAALSNDGLAGKPSRRPTWAKFYRVALEGFSNAGGADTAASLLRHHGLHDLLVYHSGRDDDASWISLGVFRELSNAVRRSEQAQLRGFDPQIVTEYISVARWYVGVAKSANAAAFAAAIETAPRVADCVASRPAASDTTVTNGAGPVPSRKKIAEAGVSPSGRRRPAPLAR